MRGDRLPAIVPLALAALAVLLSSCGSTTKTVRVSNAPPVASGKSASTPAQTQSTASAPSTATAPPAPASTATTRSAPEPAFTKSTGESGGQGAAAAAVRALGYTPNDSSQYHEGQTLGVLVGTRSAGHGQQAFFFVNGRYIGTDSKLPSANVKVVSQGDTEVTLAYPLYRPGDPLGSPSGGEAHVSFQLNDGKLVPLAAIPPASTSAALSRR